MTRFRSHSRWLAGLEALLVFGLVAFTFRWLNSLDLLRWQPGWATAASFWPYLALWLFSPLYLWLTRRHLPEYGLTLRPWRYHLQIAGRGFIPFFILSVCLTWIPWQTGWGSAVITAIILGLIFATAKLMRNIPDAPLPLELMAAGFILVPLAASGIGKAFFNLGMVYLLVAPAEEMFFRGLLLSRFDQAFGRPYCWLGIRWGWGLVASAILFGLWHPAVSLIPSWPQALWTCFAGLLLGMLREKSGSSLAPALLHGVMNYGPQAFLFDLFFTR